MVTPVRRNLQENVPLFYPFSQFRATNVLANFYHDPSSAKDFSVTKVPIKKLKGLLTSLTNHFHCMSRFFFWDVVIL